MRGPFKQNLISGIVSIVIALSLILTACASAAPSPTTTPTSVPPTQTPTSTPEPTPTPSVAPPDAQGSAFDQALLDEIWNSDHIQAQKAQWEAWIGYWTGAITPPIPTDTKELRYELLTDPSDPPQGANDSRLNEKAVLLLTWHDPLDKTTIVRAFIPLNATDGGFQTEPPAVENPYEIEEGTDPLLLTDGANRPLIWRGNGFVRIDPVSRLAREVIDINGQWVPAYGVEAISPEMYTLLQWEMINNSPTVSKDGMPLVKGFTTGSFAERMFYFGAGNEVKAVWDAEKGVVHPAMMMNSGKMLVVNERGMHEMMLNPLTPDAPDVVHILPEYWRWRVCNINAPNLWSLEEVEMEPVEKDCRVYLKRFLGTDMRSDPGRYVKIVTEMPVVIVLTVDKDDIIPTNRKADGMVDYQGVKFYIDEPRLVLEYWRDKNISTSTHHSQLASDIMEPLKRFLFRIDTNFEYSTYRLFQEYFVNIVDYSSGRNNNPDTPVPVIYGKELQVGD